MCDIMKILRISTYLEGGGAESSMRDYLIELSKRGHKVLLVYLRGNNSTQKELERNGIVVVRSSFSLTGIAKILALYKRFSPDVVHATLYKAEIISILLKMMYSAKVVVNRDVDFWAFRKDDLINKLTDKLLHKYIVYPLCDRIVAITNYVKEYIVNILGFKTNKIDVVYYGLKYADNDKEKSTKKGEVRIGFVGRLVPQKGVIIFLRTLLNMNVKKKVIVDVYGDGPYYKILRNFKPHLKKKNIHLNLHGFVSDVRKKYKDMDILFLPTQYEGFGLVFLEALFTRYPILLTSKIHPLDEVIGNHGIFCDKQDVVCFSKKLEQIINDVDKYRKRVYVDIDKHLEKFRIEKVTSDLEEVYMKVIGVAK